MRCLAVADLHYSLPQFDWLVSAAPHFDLVIFAGDALDVGSLVDFRAQIVVIKNYLSILSSETRGSLLRQPRSRRAQRSGRESVEVVRVTVLACELCIATINVTTEKNTVIWAVHPNR